MSISRRTLLASLGLTLPVAAAEAATRRRKPHVVRHNVSNQTASHRVPRTHRTAPPAQS